MHAPSKGKGERFLLLGGAGMVGQQIAYEIAQSLSPENIEQIVICGLTWDEVNRATANFEAKLPDFPKGKLEGIAADIFLRKEWNPIRGEVSKNPLRRDVLLGNEQYRETLYQDLFDKIEKAYPHSRLVGLIEDYRPTVIIDSVNTATALSYQDDGSAAAELAKKELKKLTSRTRPESSGDEAAAGGDAAADAGRESQGGGPGDAFRRAVEEVLVSQSAPQLVRHVLLLNNAMKEFGTRLYLKIGTTGTGGMGLNIPYTHSEDKPSSTLMEKTAIAFAHTGLLYLMARTLGGPAVKEFKPAAMIGYADIGYRKVRVKAKGKLGVPGQPVKLYAAGDPEPLTVGGELRLRPPGGDAPSYEELGDLEMAVVNTGENGLFTKGEFQAITYMRQMEFITPEEIAQQVVLEVMGSNTGYDVIAAIDGASMNPTYRAGYLRHLAIEQLRELEAEKNIPSVALGDLGPPELGKMLWEAHLLQAVYGRKNKEDRFNELDRVIEQQPEDLALAVNKLIEDDAQLRNTIVSVGFPILTREGTLIRGPYLRIPEEKNEVSTRIESWDKVEEWAKKGWVDLRVSNMERWLKWFKKMRHETERIRERGSAAFTLDAYVSEQIHIGSVVGWIFNNEENFGHRIK